MNLNNTKLVYVHLKRCLSFFQSFIIKNWIIKEQKWLTEVQQTRVIYICF